MLGQVQLVTPLPDMSGDPVLVPEPADRRVLVPRRPVLLAAARPARRRFGGTEMTAPELTCADSVCRRIVPHTGASRLFAIQMILR